MHFDTEGTYNLVYTAEDECGNTTLAERVVNVCPVYGAYWQGDSYSGWARTDASANFADPQPAIANGTGSSPFDNIMPWSGMRIVEDAEAGTLVSIPKYWYKIETNVQYNRDVKIQIASRPLDGFSVSPAHRDRGDGFGERDVVYVGRYFCASDYKSKTNVQPLVNETRATFRSGISALGTDVWQYDFSMYWTIVFLYLVEFANWNSQDMIGYGCGTTYPDRPNTGSTDAMQYHTGTDASARNEYGNVQYRHIEGLWSGAYGWVDGIVVDYRSGAGDMYISEYHNPSDYADVVSSDSEKASVVATMPKYQGVPTAWLLQNTQYPKLEPVKSNNNVVSTSMYSCDKINLGTLSGTYMLRMNGLYASLNSGLFGWQANETASGAASYIGSRLQKLPSA